MTLEFRHNLGFIPKDVIPLAFNGDKNVDFRLDLATKDTITIIAQGPVSIRCLIGAYRLKQQSTLRNLTQVPLATGATGPAGPPGAPGAPGATENIVVSKVAGETISAGKAVYLDTATVVKLSDHSVVARQKCVGIAKTAATIGQPIEIITDGIFQDAIFSGFNLNDAFWVGTNGTLTQTPPTSGVLLEAGYYMGQNKIEIEIERPIVLA